MTKTLLQPGTLLLLFGVVLAILWGLRGSVELADDHWSSRPAGSVEDITSLAERDDLNVLFILIDTLRADRLTAYGYERATSPALAELTSSGVRFSRHLAQSSWTKCSMASMWTGLYPTRTGVKRFDHLIPDAAVMPAERLRDAGFRTVGLYRNGWVAPNFGFDQGFDVYTRPALRRVNAKVRAANPTISMRGTDEDAIAAGIEFLRVEGKDKPWFLYLHLMDVHEYLYDEESAIFGSEYSDKYDASIRWTDGSLAILFSYLEDFDLARKTLVVVTSDHGEAFRERGIEGHARAVYKESTEVPLIIGLPFRLPAPVVVPTRTQNVDVWPTIFDLIGIDASDASDGVSRVPEILAAARGDAEPPMPGPAFAFLDGAWGRPTVKAQPLVAVASGSMRYVRSDRSSGDTLRVTEELFDSARDPAELVEQSREEVAELERLRELSREFLAAEPVWGDAPTREIDEMELNQLRALGYAIP